MQLKTVEIKNIKGIDYLRFEAGALTVLRGQNGCGKSSVLDAIGAVFNGGHDPALLRQGEKKGEVVMTLDDGSTLEAVITNKGTVRPCKSPDGKIIDAPMTYIGALAKGFAFDPLAFVSAGTKDRAAYLSKVMPIEISAVQVLAKCDKRHSQAVARLFTGEKVFDIALLNGLRKRIYEDRAATNKAIKTQEGGIDALRKTLPDNWKPGGDADEVVREAADVVARARVELAEVERKQREAVASFDAAAAVDMANVDKWEASEIDKIRQEATKRRGELSAAVKSARDNVAADYAEAIAAARLEVSEALSSESVAKEKARGFAVQAQSAATIAQYQKDLKDAQAEADTFTAAIEAIDAAKEAALKQCPIPGLSTVDGEVMYQQEGLEQPIPFDSVNTQKQYELALRIAAMGAGELGLMVLDNTEALDTANWAAFKAAAAVSGFQVIAARVDDVPELDVEPINA